MSYNNNAITNNSGIYQIVNNITQKRYIGYATNLRTRWNGHLHDLLSNKHGNDYLQKAWNKYGKENFTFSILQECIKEKLCLYEDYWVKVLKVTDREFGYNLKDTDPNGTPGCSEETKAKLRISNKNAKPSELCKLRRREYWSTHTVSEEQKLAMWESRKHIDYKKLHREKRGKKVIDLSTGIIYGSLGEVCDFTGLIKSTLSKYLVGSRTNKTNFKYI